MVAAIVARWKRERRKSTAYSYRFHLQKLLGVLAGFGAPVIAAPKLPRGGPRAVVFKGEELTRLLSSGEPYIRLFILLYLQCGLRLAEAMRVSPRSWDPEQHSVTIKVKGDRTRAAAVTPEVEALFAAALADPTDDTPFIHLLRGRPLTPHAMREAWNRHRQKCGVSPATTAHDLRRTAASIVYAATKDLRIPQQLLGHQNLASTLAYIAPLAPEEAHHWQELLRFERFKSEVNN